MKIKLTTVALLSAFSISAYALPATIGSPAGIEASIVDSGNFNLSGGEGSLGLSYLGKEWINWGTHASWSWLTSSLTPLGVNTDGGANPLGATILGSNPTSFVINGNLGGTSGLSFVQLVSLNSSNQLGVTVQLINNSGKDITGVKWGVGLDPDINLSVGGGYNTLNTILGQGTNAAVSAFGDLAGQKLTLANTTSASAFDIAAYIGNDCCTPVDPAAAILGAQSLGFSNNADDSISLAYNIGTIGARKTISFGYSYTITAVPEPETYAMLLAGIGMIGFVGFRRNLQA